MTPRASSMRSRISFLLALAVSSSAVAQDFAGTWSGGARLTNDWPGLTCVYDGSKVPGSVKLELVRAKNELGGTIVIDIAAAPGSGCPPLRKQYLVTEARVSEAALTLLDSGGNEWNLAARQEGSALKGLLAFKEGGAPEALAAGFTVGGQTPLVRLSGEVNLERPSTARAQTGKDPAPGAASDSQPAPGAGAEPGAGAAPAAGAKANGGNRAGYVAAILGANVVAAGVIYGVNQLGKGNGSGTTSCSPRNCFIGAPGEPCLCNANVLSGASCGTVPGGVPLGGACDGTSRPCQSGFSCNRGICEDAAGACPY